MSFRRYSIKFADGKSATYLDPSGDKPESVIHELFAFFAKGYVLRVDPL